MKRLIVTMVAAMATAMAVAQEPEGGRMGPRGPRPHGSGMAEQGDFGMGRMLGAVQNPKVAEKLGLSDEQKARLKEISFDREEMKRLHEKVRKGMETQMKLLDADEIDENAVMDALDEVWDAREDIAKIQTKRIIAVRKVLTKEQVAKAREMFVEMRKHHGPRFKGGDQGDKGAQADKEAQGDKEAAQADKGDKKACDGKGKHGRKWHKRHGDRGRAGAPAEAEAK